MRAVLGPHDPGEPADLGLAIGLLQAEIKAKQALFRVAADSAETHCKNWEREIARAREFEQTLDHLHGALARLVALQDHDNQARDPADEPRQP